jgi:hypothetical protein
MRREDTEVLDILYAARRNAIWSEQSQDPPTSNMHIEITRHLIDQACRIIQAKEKAQTN